jgi:uracil-DNA glycosylase family 4
LEGDSLEQVASEVRPCTKCDLCRTRTHAVPGAGNPAARVMFVGEGPGYNEDQQGLPFVGQAGKYLDELLGIAGLKRPDVFITNVVKCRPPSNRDPLPDEIAACSEYLERQMNLIDPALIVTLGRFSMARWFPSDRISKIHGQERRFGNRMVMPMYHPAAALRTGTVKQMIEQDFARLPEVIVAAEKMRSNLTATPPPDVGSIDQLELF